MPVTGLAIVLLVIIILIGIVLFRPIVYSFEVVARKPYKAEIYIEWWGKMFLVHFKYEQGTPFFQEVYILRKARLGAVRDYEDWLARRVEEETTDTDEAQMADAQQSNTKTEQAASVTDKRTDQDTTAEAVEPLGKLHFKADGTLYEEDAARLEKWKAAEAARKAKEAEEAAGESAASKETAAASTDETADKDTKKEKVSDPHKWWWVKHVTNSALYEKLLLLMKRSYNHSKPREAKLEGIYGNGDPYKMGITAAALYSIWPEQMANVQLNYTERAFEGSIFMKGHILPGVMAWYGTLFVFSKPMRDLIVDVIKFALRQRKKKKELQKAEKKQKEQLA